MDTVEIIADWRPAEEKPGYRVRTIKYKNATIHIYRPILSPEEQALREKQVINVLESCLRDTAKRMATRKEIS